MDRAHDQSLGLAAAAEQLSTPSPALAALKAAARRELQGYVLDAVQVRAAGHDIVGERGLSAMKFNRQQLRPLKHNRTLVAAWVKKKRPIECKRSLSAARVFKG